MLNQNQTIKDNIKKFNQRNPLIDYLVPFLGVKKEIKIADIGSGPYSIIGHFYTGKEIEIYYLDNQDFSKFWEKYKVDPLVLVEHQDMEKLTYDDNFFDIVHCANALDHTFDALAAVKEMIRVCKEGGWIYITCYLDQKKTGHKHYWDVLEDGRVADGFLGFDLKEFGFQITYIDNGGERRYNQIIAILKK